MDHYLLLKQAVMNKIASKNLKKVHTGIDKLHEYGSKAADKLYEYGSKASEKAKKAYKRHLTAKHELDDLNKAVAKAKKSEGSKELMKSQKEKYKAYKEKQSRTRVVKGGLAAGLAGFMGGRISKKDKKKYGYEYAN